MCKQSIPPPTLPGYEAKSIKWMRSLVPRPPPSFSQSWERGGWWTWTHAWSRHMPGLHLSKWLTAKAPFSRAWSHTLGQLHSEEATMLWTRRCERWDSDSVRRTAKSLSSISFLICVKETSSGENSTFEVKLELYTVAKNQHCLTRDSTAFTARARKTREL